MSILDDTAGIAEGLRRLTQGAVVPVEEIETESGWFWYAGTDRGEYNLGPYPSRQAAIDDALARDIECTEDDDGTLCFFVVRSRPHSASEIHVNPYAVLEQIEDYDYPDWRSDEGDALFEITSAQHTDLDAMLTEAFQAWIVKHGIKPNIWTFAEEGEFEKILLPEEEDEAGDDA